MVQLLHVNFRYKSKETIFEDLSLTLAPGHIFGLLGKNGAGKSTLLKIMAGLIFPQKGVCTAFHQPIKERRPTLLQNLFIVPEEFDLPGLTINQFVKVNSLFYPKFNQVQFEVYLKEFQIEQKKLSSLSFGQKKKFLLAFAFATNANLLILDEPTNGLDIPSKSQFRKIIASAMNEEKIIVISTHQVRDLENLIDSIVVVDQGKIIFNQDLQTISEKLLFDNDIHHVSQEEVLYTADGRNSPGIRMNKEGIESKVDLETLFNAVILNTQKINAQF